jgi:hypothetical protein
MPAAYELILKKKCIFFIICFYTPAEQTPPKLAEANKTLAND